MSGRQEMARAGLDGTLSCGLGKVWDLIPSQLGKLPKFCSAFSKDHSSPKAALLPPSFEVQDIFSRMNQNNLPTRTWGKGQEET